MPTGPDLEDAHIEYVTGKPRDLDAERAEFERMISRQSEASREYNRGKFTIKQQD